MEAWDEACKREATHEGAFMKRTDGVKCPDCGTDTVRLEEVDANTRKMTCVSYAHEFWFVKTGERCHRCKTCEWTDSSKRQKQLRSADEGAHVTVCCMHGCKVIRA